MMDVFGDEIVEVDVEVADLFASVSTGQSRELEERHASVKPNTNQCSTYLDVINWRVDIPIQLAGHSCDRDVLWTIPIAQKTVVV